TPVTGSPGTGPARRGRDAGPCRTPASQPPPGGSTRCARPAGSTDSAALASGHHHTALTHGLSSARYGRRTTTLIIFTYTTRPTDPAYASRIHRHRRRRTGRPDCPGPDGATKPGRPAW